MTPSPQPKPRQWKASDPFRFPPERIYKIESWFNVDAWFERVYGSGTQTVKDPRSYKASVVVYLQKHGATLINSDTLLDCTADKTLNGENELKASLDAVCVDDGIPSYSQDAIIHLWYKGQVIKVQGKDDQLSLSITSVPEAKISFDEFKGHLAPVEATQISVLMESNGSYYTRVVDFAPPVIDDLNLNYGPGFGEIHRQIATKLEAKHEGLLIFRGPPGTGKSTYIKYLTKAVDREFIFVPVSMANGLASPAFVKLLLDHPGAVLILEDAEQALQSREVDFYASSTVSALLNLSDGILGTLLHVAVIASHNTDHQTIDKALLRKGRLMFDYEFIPLKVEDARKLAAHLKKEITITEPTSLADIYNANEDTGYKEPERRAIGFGAKVSG
jgi:hypothetical protein